MRKSAFSPEQYDDKVVCLVLIDNEGNIIAQQRDDKPGINSPGMISFFGGYVEPTDPTLEDAALRELSEETSLRLTKNDISFYDEFVFGEKKRLLHTLFIAKGISTEGLQVYEGQGFVQVKSLSEPKLAKVFIKGSEKWFAERERT